MVEVVHQGNVFFFLCNFGKRLWLCLKLLKLNQSKKKTTSITIGLACNYTLIHLGGEYHKEFYIYAVCLRKPSARLCTSNVVEKQKSSSDILCLEEDCLLWWYRTSMSYLLHG